MRRVLPILLSLMLCQVVVAQLPVQHHRCWDIDFAEDKPAAVTPLVAGVEVDSGAILVEFGKQFLGTPYRYGGKTPQGFDCAGYARYLYQHFGHTLPPYSGGQYQVGQKIADRCLLRAGDLVFFGGRNSHSAVGHTGVVVEGDGKGGFHFIHSATNGGVIISHSSEPYYAQRYIGACRIFKQ